ncbi:hypothetical protein BDD12DRAFT_882917 [Trichophaea hybrida]|nr:hypothetical protein BDD12DRAFT_882917 [Trichophaea hybrida]
MSLRMLFQELMGWIYCGFLVSWTLNSIVLIFYGEIVIAPVIAGAPEILGGPETLETYDILGAPEMLCAPETLQIPEILGAPEIPGASNSRLHMPLIRVKS